MTGLQIDVLHLHMLCIGALRKSLFKQSIPHVQLEIRSGMALTFQNTNGTMGSGTLTSSGTYLTTANFTGGGNFDTVVLPTLSTSSGCGSYTDPSIQLAVLVLSLDASVSPAAYRLAL